MDLPQRKINMPPANFNRPVDKPADNQQEISQRRLGLVLARANLLGGDLTHISISVRRVLARLASRRVE